VPDDEDKPPRLALPNLPENLTFSSETHFALVVPCIYCQGTGRDQDQSKLYNPTLTLDDLRCKECKGVGKRPRYMTLQELYETMEPYFLQRAYDKFLANLPEILAAMQYEVVRSVMES